MANHWYHPTRRATKRCAWCERPFSVKLSRATEARCCSVPCRAKWQRVAFRGDRRFMACQSPLPAVKRCRGCGQEKPLTPEFFFRRNRTATGLQHVCKTCHVKRVKMERLILPDRWRRYDKTKFARRRAAGAVDPHTIRRLYWFQDGRCAYCRSPLGAVYHLEHMQPIARGGTSNPTNLCLACPDCNARKRLDTVADFLARPA